MQETVGPGQEQIFRVPRSSWQWGWLAGRDNPRLFVTRVLRVLELNTPNPNDEPQLSHWQAGALDDLAKYDRISIKSGHGTGKTTFLSWVILWFLLTRQDVKIPVAANSQDQLRDIVWPEVKKWWRRLPLPLQEQIDIQAEKIVVRIAPDNAFAVRRTASKQNSEALQGFHADNLLFIIEEACFDDKTEVLTDQGWKLFSELTQEERLLTKPQDGGAAYFEYPSKYFKYAYKGELVSYKTRALDFRVTPNHRLWVGATDCASGKITWGFQEAGGKLNQRLRIDRTFSWEGSPTQTFTVPPFQGRSHHTARVVKMEDWLEFLGWFLSEGSIGRNKGRPYTVVISQKKKEALERISDCCRRLGFSPCLYFYEGGASCVKINNVQLASFLDERKRATEKRIPRYVMELPSDKIRIFLDSYLEGDGYRKGPREVYYTSSPGMADDLQELLLRMGVHASICRRDMPKSDFSTHTAHPTGDGYVVATYAAEHAALRSKDMTRTQYDGFVYCVEIPKTHLVYVRRNGVCHWSGNSGIDDVVFEVAMGALSTKGAKVILAANPTRTSGYFYDTHHKLRDRWRCITVNSEDVPRARGHIQDVIDAYGKGSNKYRVRVLGEFPTADDDTVIALDIVEAAIKREVEELTDYIPVWGFDVARFGDDDNALCKRRFNMIMEPVKTWGGVDLAVTLGRIKREFYDTPEYDRPKKIMVDVIGLGAGLVDIGRTEGLPLYGVNVAEAASVDDQYMRLRDELWFLGRQWFEKRDCGMPDDPALVGELTTPRYDFHANGKKVVESKRELKNRGVKSPNRADSFLLTFATNSERRVIKKRNDARRSSSWAG